ncbi:MAG: PilW family protein [Burkholderiales bacterium]|nr:PilW family protein [Burkholderiales bacterium]
MATLTTPLNSRRSQGFTLVEVLVGMAVALIGMVMMFQSMQVWESRKRTTTGGSDAQVSGSIAMFSLERDLKMAGYGFGNAMAMNCTVSAYDSTRSAPGTFTFPMVPALITDGAAGAPDTLTVLYGSGTTLSSSQSFNNLTPPPAVANDGFKRTNTRTGLRPGDLMIAADSGNAICGLFEVTGNANADGLTVDHGTGAYLNFANNQNVTAQSLLAADALARLQAQFLNNSGSVRYNDGTAKGVGSTGAIFNLGTAPQLNVWQISNQRFLTVDNNLANQPAPTEVAEGIINLQAEYGVDTNGNGVVDAGEWSAAAPANWQQLRAIRVALLARSQQFEKTAVTTVAPAWAGGAFTMANVDGTADTAPGNANDWRRYRYRVYETVIPLRNIIWGMS